MKKKGLFKKAISFAAVLVLCVAFAACGGGGEGSSSSQNLIMGTGGTSGTWYSVGGVICGALSTSDLLNATAQTSAGGVENIRLVSTNERQLGFCMPSLAIYAKDGVESFDGEKIENIRAICQFMPMQAHFIVRDKSSIKSIEDIKGKAIGTGAAGSGDEVMCREILDAVGITYDDVDEQLLSFSEQVTAFKDGQIDVMFMLASAPTASVMDAASQADCRILSVEGDLEKKVLDAHNYYYETTIPKDSYDFLKEDVTTIGISTMLFTNAEMSDDVVYEICNKMFEEANLKAIQESHGSMADFSLDTAIEGLTVELHPGAQKYYDEKKAQ